MCEAQLHQTVAYLKDAKSSFRGTGFTLWEEETEMHTAERALESLFSK